jgi:competence protein ComEC
MLFHVSPNRLEQGIRNVRILSPKRDSSMSATLIAWNGKKVLLVDTPIQNIRPVEVDYLVISQNALKYYSIPKQIKASAIILDSSNSYYFAERMMKYASEQGLQIHSVRHEGAFQVKL